MIALRITCIVGMLAVGMLGCRDAGPAPQGKPRVPAINKETAMSIALDYCQAGTSPDTDTLVITSASRKENYWLIFGNVNPQIPSMDFRLVVHDNGKVERHIDYLMNKHFEAAGAPEVERSKDN